VLGLGVAAATRLRRLQRRGDPHPDRLLPAEPATAAGIARAHWSALPPSPLGPRSDLILTWTGSELAELIASTGQQRSTAGIPSGRWGIE